MWHLLALVTANIFCLLANWISHFEKHLFNYFQVLNWTVCFHGIEFLCEENKLKMLCLTLQISLLGLLFICCAGATWLDVISFAYSAFIVCTLRTLFQKLLPLPVPCNVSLCFYPVVWKFQVLSPVRETEKRLWAPDIRSTQLWPLPPLGE